MSAFALATLLERFSVVEASKTVDQVVADEQTKPVVVFSYDKEEEYAAKPFIAPLLFLFRGRSDLVLVQAPVTGGGVAPSLVVYKGGAQVASVTSTEGTLKDRVSALIAQVGWSPGTFKTIFLLSSSSPYTAC